MVGAAWGLEPYIPGPAGPLDAPLPHPIPDSCIVQMRKLRLTEGRGLTKVSQAVRGRAQVRIHAPLLVSLGLPDQLCDLGKAIQPLCALKAYNS